MEDKITVVIAIYNVEQYVHQCISSIINQVYKNLQIILVDDGSFDLSGQICDNFALEDERIEVIHQSNRGLSEARNAGIRAAKGNWIAFVDGDDYLHPQFIDILYKAAENSGSEIAICDYKKVKENECVQYRHIDEYKSIELSSAQMLQNWHGKMTKIETIAWNKLYNISLFQKEVWYPKGKLHEDVYVTHLLIAKAQKIVIVKEKLYMYLQRNNSIVRTKLTEYKVYQNIEAQEMRICFFNKKQYPKAYRNLKWGIIKYAAYFYWKTLSNKEFTKDNKGRLRLYLLSRIRKYIIN